MNNYEQVTHEVRDAFNALCKGRVEAAVNAEREQGQKWFDAVTAQHKQEILAEREACAKLAATTVCDVHIPTGVKIYGTAVAKAIRARGQA